MQITGIICEYNPLHLGHQKQIEYLRAQGHSIVCLMSGNFVQRGQPAIFDKTVRARAAVLSGADLVLELPIPYALSSAESFAAGGAEILSQLCDNICFGAETADSSHLMNAAKVLLSPDFSEKLRSHLDKGLSFPAARQKTVCDCGLDASILETPNNILSVEYCKAILAQASHLQPIVIHRPGSYHDTTPDATAPSATAVRKLLKTREHWQAYVPAEAADLFSCATIHTLEQGENAILARLRSMTDTEFEALPYGSEGLWRKLMHASRKCATLEEIIASTKSKRYTRTRIDRMILSAYLGLIESDITSPAPYCRVLAFNDMGRQILNGVKESGYFVNIGEDTRHPYQAIERRCTSLYGLFADKPESPTAEEEYRVYYKR